MTLYPALKNKSEEWGGEWYREGKEREMPAELSLKLRPLPLLSCLKRNACMPSSSFPLHPPVPLPPDPEFHRAHESSQVYHPSPFFSDHSIPRPSCPSQSWPAACKLTLAFLYEIVLGPAVCSTHSALHYKLPLSCLCSEDASPLVNTYPCPLLPLLSANRTASPRPTGHQQHQVQKN